MDVDAKRAVLRAFSYGLYAVGVRAGERANLFTANWATQVSFEPPLVMLAVENDSFSLPVIRESGVFAISVLRDDQKEVARTLGRAHSRTPDKLALYPTEAAPSGCPVLVESLGWADCRVTADLPAGDHTLMLAEVTAVRPNPIGGEPLLMRPAGFKYAG